MTSRFRKLFALLEIIFLVGTASASTITKPPTPRKSISISKEYRDTIEKNHHTFDHCAQAEVVRTKRAIKGIVLIRFIANGDGKVNDSIVIHNTTNSRPVADCLMRNLEQTKFPASFSARKTSAYAFHFDIKP
jgi:hypothetical protein